MEKNPLNEQIGGDHYAKLKIQPMEYSMANNLNACQHTAIKYITRYKDKGGVQDLDKAIHTIEMLKTLEYGDRLYPIAKEGEVLILTDHEKAPPYTTEIGIVHEDVDGPATEREKQRLFDALEEVGKRWNPEKKVIEDISDSEECPDDPEELVPGDVCIFWDQDSVDQATIDRLSAICPGYYRYRTKADVQFNYAVKWDGTFEHLEKVRKREL